MVGREGGSSGIDVVWIVFQRRGVSFYGLRFYGYTVLWILCGSATTTTTATSTVTATATATTGRLFEALRVYNVEVLSTVRFGSVEVRFGSVEFLRFLGLQRGKEVLSEDLKEALWNWLLEISIFRYLKKGLIGIEGD